MWKTDYTARFQDSLPTCMVNSKFMLPPLLQHIIGKHVNSQQDIYKHPSLRFFVAVLRDCVLLTVDCQIKKAPNILGTISDHVRIPQVSVQTLVRHYD